MDIINAALQTNIVPNQEYYLQGSILDTSLEILLHRLRGLCDNASTGPHTFNEHEMVFSIKGGPNVQPLTLTVRHSLNAQNESIEMPWILRYLGNPEVGDKSRPTLVRSYIDIPCSSNLVEFLTEMGFRLEYEYVLKGYLFCKGRMKITVSKIFKMNQGKLFENLESLTNSHLIEVNVVTVSGQESIAEDVKTFAEQLKPLVQLEKTDPRRLSNI